MDIVMTLNTASGVLHRSKRCAGRDERFHHQVVMRPGEELLAFLYLRFTGLCRKEFGR